MKFPNSLFNDDNKVYSILNKEVGEQIRRFSFTVDLTNIKQEVIDTKAVFVKGDKDVNVLNANIIQNAKPFNLTGYIVTINLKENENNIETFICTIKSSENGLIEINIPSRFVDEDGKCIFELCFQKETRIIYSQMYSYKILASLGEGTPGTDGQMTALQSLINEVQSKIDKVDNLVEDMNVSQSDIDEIINMIGR